MEELQKLKDLLERGDLEGLARTLQRMGYPKAEGSPGAFKPPKPTFPQVVQIRGEELVAFDDLGKLLASKPTGRDSVLIGRRDEEICQWRYANNLSSWVPKGYLQIHEN